MVEGELDAVVAGGQGFQCRKGNECFDDVGVVQIGPDVENVRGGDQVGIGGEVGLRTVATSHNVGRMLV